MLEGPQGIVGRITPFSFYASDCRGQGRRGRDINLRGGLDVVLASQEGVSQRRPEDMLVGSPVRLQAGGPPDISILGVSGISKMQGGLALPNRLKNIVIVIDTSSSMRRERLPLFQAQIERLASSIPKGTIVSVITFNEHAAILVNGAEINSPKDFKQKVAKPIKEIVCGRGTKLDNAFTKTSEHIGKLDGYDHIHPERSLILFVTDGDHMPNTIDEYRKINIQAQKLSPFRNSSIVFVGVGTNYNTDLIQQMAGFSGGSYLHLSSDTDIFRNQIPKIIKEQSGDVFIRVDAYGINRLWALNPSSIQEVPYADERSGIDEIIGLHELRGGYQNEPAGISIFNPNDFESVKYYIAGQPDARLYYEYPDEITKPDDFGRKIPIRMFEDLQPEDRWTAEEHITRWLKTLVMDKRDPLALQALKEAHLIKDDEYERLASFLQAGEEESRSVASEVASANIDINDIKSLLGGSVQSSQGQRPDADFLEKLKDLGNILPKRRNKNQPQPGSFVDSGNQSQPLHSGGLGPLSMEPADQLAPFEGPQPGAAERYDQVEPVKEEQTKRPNLSMLCTNPRVRISDAVFKKDKITIGRSDKSDIVINLSNISRNHCQMVFDNGSYYIEDTKSNNGVYVNGIKIDKTQLKDGDIVQLCNVQFVIYLS